MQPQTVRASYNVAGLGNPFRLSNFQEVLDGKLQNDQPLETSSEKWTFFRDTVTEVAKEVLGAKTRTHKDWFDEKSKDALRIKNNAFIKWQNDLSSVSKRDKFKTLQVKVQSELRQMQDNWWELKAAQVQLYADTHNAKKFFSSLKMVFSPSASGCSPLLSSDGSTLINHIKIKVDLR